MPLTPSGPSIVTQIRDLAARVARLERGGPEILAPAPVGGTSTSSTTPVGLWAALATGTGAGQTWTVSVTPAAGVTAHLRLRDALGTLGDETTSTSAATVDVTMPHPVDWANGDRRMVWLDVWGTGTAGTVTAFVVRAVGA